MAQTLVIRLTRFGVLHLDSGQLRSAHFTNGAIMECGNVLDPAALYEVRDLESTYKYNREARWCGLCGKKYQETQQQPTGKETNH